VKRLKTAKGRKVSSTRWLERQLNDPYVKRARAENYRSRAAYKLIELDERFGFLRGVTTVVDLGIAPGGWSQVVRRKIPRATVVGIDLLPTDPIEGVTILEMDFMDEDAPAKLREALGSEVLVHFTVDAPPVLTEDTKELVGEQSGPMAHASVAVQELEKAAAIGTSTFVARLDPRTRAAERETLELAIDTARIHFFDPGTGLGIYDES